MEKCQQQKLVDCSTSKAGKKHKYTNFTESSTCHVLISKKLIQFKVYTYWDRHNLRIFNQQNYQKLEHVDDLVVVNN